MRSRYGLTTGFLCLVVVTCLAQEAKPTPEVVRVLAPTGRLRVGLYVGNPASLLKEPATGDGRGVGFELGREFARWLGIPFEPVVYPNNGAVLEGMRAGQIDVVFTNATAARAKEIDFAPAAVEVEAGFLVPSGSPIASIGDVDKQGIRVGVMEGSTSSTILPGVLKSASVVRVPNLETVTKMLSSRALDAFATNKSILYEISDTLPGSTVLDGRYGVEQLALGIPKGRELGLPYAQTFVAAAISGGLVKAAISRAGLRGGTVNIGVK
jgi:polar amino acid transport system substrate-binding protein